MRDPFSQLMDEHRVIERMLAALEAAARLDVPLDFYARALDFAEGYAEGYHHAKEEEMLFTYLKERGAPRDFGPVDVMIEEHHSGQQSVRAMRGMLEEGDVEGLRRESLAYASLMREHIQKEDEILFPMGRAMLTAGEIEEVHASFSRVPEPAVAHRTLAQQAAALLAEVESVT